jgi:hypothetical protein
MEKGTEEAMVLMVFVTLVEMERESFMIALAASCELLSTRGV